MRQLVYTMFISNNRASFHLWWKENLVKHQKVSKHVNDCLQNFVLLFMSWWTAKFVKNSHIYARIYFVFLNIVLKQTWNSFNIKFEHQWKDRRNSYQIRQILALFCNLIAQILDYNSVKGLRVIKIVKEITFEGIWGELESKKSFQRQSFTKYLRLNLVFMWNSTLWEKWFLFFKSILCWY